MYSLQRRFVVFFFFFFFCLVFLGGGVVCTCVYFPPGGGEGLPWIRIMQYRQYVTIFVVRRSGFILAVSCVL